LLLGVSDNLVELFFLHGVSGHSIELLLEILDLLHDSVVKGLGSRFSAVFNFLVNPSVIVEFASLLEVLVGLFVVLNPVLFDVVSLKFECLGGSLDGVNFFFEVLRASNKVGSVNHLLVKLMDLSLLSFSISQGLYSGQLSADFTDSIQSYAASLLKVSESSLSLSKSLNPLFAEVFLL